MRTRLAALTLALGLSLALQGCNKPAAPADSNSSTASPSSNDSSNTAAAPGGNNAGSSSNSGASSPMSNTAMSNMKPEPPKPLVVPAGTVLTVRLGQAVGSKISTAGQTFTATVASAVTADGREAIPAGATASGTVVDAKPLGRFKGGAELRLRLTSVNVKGADRSISTSSVTRTETGKGTAILAGGGAAVGALIGGLAGGGKGAGIGALAGGGAGTGGAAFTGNKDIVLPAESALSFKLEQPLEVK
jgi:hypothetical protein